VNKEIEYLGLDVDGRASVPQLVLADVDFETREQVFHYHFTGGLLAVKTTSSKGKTEVL
jgi:hypothetical protein